MKQYIGKIYPHPDFKENGRYFKNRWDTPVYGLMPYGSWCSKCHTPLCIHGNGYDCNVAKYNYDKYPPIKYFALNTNIIVL